MKEGRKYDLTLEVNGALHKLQVEPFRTLLHVLREDLGLLGAKEGCGMGECGACTVIVDDKPIKSCISLALQADGKRVRTIEGLAEGGGLDPLQQAFIDHGAIQCGYCTPGMILTAKTLTDENPTPTENEIRQYLSGNLCRCTGYVKIIEAVQGALETGEKP